VVNAKDVLQDSQIFNDSFSDLHLKPKEAWIMDLPDSAKTALPMGMQKRCLHSVVLYDFVFTQLGCTLAPKFA